MERKFSLKEKWFLIILFLTSLLSLIFYISYQHQAFPEYAIDFSLTREDAQQKAQAFAQKIGLHSEGHKSATIFSADPLAKTYLERELGVQETARLAENGINLWYFNTRFFQPLVKDEFTVGFTPDGRVARFSRLIEESAPGENLSKEQAETIARQFLTQKVDEDISQWELISSEALQRPNRTDHVLMWKKKDFKAKEADYLMVVQVLGNQIGTYEKFLKVPEAWQRQYQKETSANYLAQTVATTLKHIFFTLAIIITFIIAFRQGQLRLRFALWAGGIVAFISLLSSLNSLPLSFYTYPTTLSWTAFIGSLLFSAFIDALIGGILTILTVASGEAIYRSVFPKKMALEKFFTHGISTKQTAKGLFIGVLVGFICLAYQISYYWLGKKVGFWSPAHLNYQEALSTSLPWVYPLLIGFLAAVSEEGMFRLFGISFFKKYLKHTWIAVLLTSVIWAFLHSAYPQSPWFVRGIELTIAGVIWSVLFLRYGIISSLAAHYTFNAFMTALGLVNPNNIYSTVSSLLVALFPLLLAVGILIRGWRKGFREEKGLLNEDLTAEILQSHKNRPESDKVEHIPATYYPLTGRKILALLILGVIGATTLFILQPKTNLQQTPVAANRTEAIELAKSALQKEGIEPNKYHINADFNLWTNKLNFTYVLQKSNLPQLQEVYNQLEPQAWVIRFFQPLQQQEFKVEVAPDGKIVQIMRTLSETDQGADLTSEEARKTAENYLTQTKGYNLNEYQLVDSKTEKKEHRTDHEFTFEHKGNKIHEATFRLDVSVKGDQITSFANYLKIPETWTREESTQTTLNFIALLILILLILAVLILTIVTSFRLIKARKANFRQGFIIGGIMAGIFLLGDLNRLPELFQIYTTSIPLESYITQSIMEKLIGIVSYFFTTSFFASILIALWKDELGLVVAEKAQQKPLYQRDGFVAGYLIPLILGGVTALLSYLLVTQGWLKEISLDSLKGADHFLPVITVLETATTNLFFSGLAGLGILVAYRYLKSWRRVSYFLVISIAALSALQAKSVQDFIIYFAQHGLFVFVVGLLVAFVARKNFLAYCMATVIGDLMVYGWMLSQQPDLFLQFNGIATLLLAIVPLLILLLSFASLKRRLHKVA